MLRQRLLFNHPAGITTVNYLLSWGDSASYATGQNTLTDIILPTQVGSDPTWIKVCAFGGNSGGYGGLGIKANGTLWAWGESANYATGLATLVDVQVPTKVNNDTDWTEVAGFVGGGFALKNNGTLWSWGLSANYQTGQNSTTDVQVPTQVGSATDWVKITAFAQGGFAIKSNGTLWSWGYTISYATGQGTTSPIQLPTQIGVDTNWTDVFGIAYGGFAIKTDRSLYSWGSSNNYATGQATLTDVQSPTRVGTDNDWIQLAGCSYTGFGLKANGTLYVWGQASNYETGRSTTTASQTPVMLGSDNNWAAVFGGWASYTGFAVKSNGQVYSWGYTANYEGGGGGTTSIQSPTALTGRTNWGSVSATTSGFAIEDMPPPVRTGALYSFGSNFYGQTGQGTTSGNTLSPSLVLASTLEWAQISYGANYWSAGGTDTLAGVVGIRTDGTLWSWGANDEGGGTATGMIAQGNVTINLSTPTQIGSATNWAHIAEGPFGGLGVKTDGTLWSWGNDAYGQLCQGGGSTKYYTPTQVGVATDWAKVFTGGSYASSRGATFIIKTNGTLWVAGSNGNYITGLGTNSGNTTTITQIGSSTWNSIAVGGQGALGIQTNGTLWSWGTDAQGELGRTVGATATTPTQVGIDTDWNFVSTSTHGNPFGATFAIKTTGTLWSCGVNTTYGTAQGTVAGNTNPLTQVGSSTLWVAAYGVDSQVFSLCGGVGLRSDGTLWSWGSNNLGMTGQGTSSGSTITPTQIGTDTDWSYVYANSSTCAFAYK